MQDPKQLTKADIIRTARTFTWTRKMPKWTVIVEQRELPARPLVLEAAGVAPNDPTNSHQAVAILDRLGFETRYAGNGGRSERNFENALPIKSGGLGAVAKMLAAISDSVPKREWVKLPSDLSKNVDHYLYGSRRNE
jgi:hypothetical protein